MRLRDMKISTKVLMLIGLMSLVTAVVATFGVTRINFLNSGLHDVNSVDDVSLLGARMNLNLIMMNQSEYRVAADPSAATIAASKAVADTNRQQFDERMSSALAAATSEAEKHQLKDIQLSYKKYEGGLDNTYATAAAVGPLISISGLQKKINDQVDIGRSRADDLQKALKAYVDYLDVRSQKTSDEATAAGKAAIIIMLSVAAGGITIGIFIGLFFSRSQLVRPITKLTSAMEAVARGDDAVLVPGDERGDEIGAMSRAFQLNAKRVLFLAEKQRERDISGVRERKEVTLKLADGFEKSVGGIITLVSAAATSMQAAATQLTAMAIQSSARTVSVSTAAEAAGVNVASVAGAAKDLGTSVWEIGRQVESSARMSNTAVREASHVALVVTELSDVAKSIGSVIDVISGLARQTNLLALNATIESARAGESGRGFAVVAAEVKQLACQTARATTEISSNIARIQETTFRAVKAIECITGTIQSINDISNDIVSAVEEQNVATANIFHAAKQASICTNEVASNITVVASAAEQTGFAASDVQSSSGKLSEQAERLNYEMNIFLSKVRST